MNGKASDASKAADDLASKKAKKIAKIDLLEKELSNMDQDIHRVDEQLEVARAHRAFLDDLAESYAGKKKEKKKDPEESTID